MPKKFYFIGWIPHLRDNFWVLCKEISLYHKKIKEDFKKVVYLIEVPFQNSKTKIKAKIAIEKKSGMVVYEIEGIKGISKEEMVRVLHNYIKEITLSHKEVIHKEEKGFPIVEIKQVSLSKLGNKEFKKFAKILKDRIIERLLLYKRSIQEKAFFELITFKDPIEVAGLCIYFENFLRCTNQNASIARSYKEMFENLDKVLIYINIRNKGFASIILGGIIFAILMVIAQKDNFLLLNFLSQVASFVVFAFIYLIVFKRLP